ncbi:Disease resistance protein RPM1 [Glycine soja]
MTETAVSLAVIQMLRGLEKEVEDTKDEPDNKVAEAEEDDGKRDRINKMGDAAERSSFSHGRLRKSNLKMILDAQLYSIAYKIQDAKSLVRVERDGFRSYFPSEKRTNNSRGNQNVTWLKLRMDPFFIEEDQIVDLDDPRYRLRKGRKEPSVISVVGILRVGKTTLSKQVFDQVHNDFECHALITMSQSYTVQELLRDITNNLCKEKTEDPPKDVSTMDQRLFTEESKKPLVYDKNGSRILITTRDEKVVEFCKKYSFVEVLKLEEPLSEEESFKFYNGRCPEELKDTALEIVRKFKGLPLAIVAIGGLFSKKDESAPEWRLFKLERNSELNSIPKILSLSYDDLPMNLRSCLLYFRMYLEDYEVKFDRLIRQWIAEGFVKHETGKLSLVQVSSFTIDGKVTRCRVHDLMHDMILSKVKDTWFCQYIGGHDQTMSSGIV